MNTEVSKFTQNVINQQVLSVIKGHENPDLVLKILYSIRGDYIDILPEKLKVPKNEVLAILDLLSENEIIRYSDRSKEQIERDELRAKAGEIRFIEAYPTNELERFLKSCNTFGPYTLIETELDEIDIGRVMNALEGIAVFYYTRTEDVPAERLEGMKRFMHDAVEELHMKENEMLRAILGLENHEQIAQGISFVSEAKPLWNDYVGNLKSIRVSISLDYKSPGEAIKNGFEEVHINLKSDIPVRGLSNDVSMVLPSDIKIYRKDEAYNLTIKNAIYHALRDWYSFPVLQEARKKTELMVERLKPIIPEIKAPTKYTKD